MRLNQFPEKDRFLELAAEYNVIPVCVEILADTETPVSLLRKIYDNRGPAFLFESVEGGERWGRYSFLGSSARSHVRIYPDAVEITEAGRSSKIPHNGDPLHVLREFMGGFRPVSLHGLPRFWGGLVGYFTYEMVSFFEPIPSRLDPGLPLAHMVIPDEILIFDNIRHTLLIVAVCFLQSHEKNPEAAYDRANTRIQRVLEAAGKPVPNGNGNCGPHILKARQPDEHYRKLVQKVKQYIHDGDVIQTVISQMFDCDSTPDLWSLYRAQRFVNPSPYLFFLHLDDTALVGSSPETMIRLENRVATLRPIAGTRPRGRNEQQDRTLASELLVDEKERAEHLMLVDLGRNDLGRVAETGTVQVTDLMFVERYSHVMHLVSNICCDLKPDADAWDLFRATFPAGTLSGAPKVRAMEIIAELETEPRGPYGGAVGYVSFTGNMDMAIIIRTACVQNGRLTVRAGAGLVADSDPERERVETVNKAMAIQKALQLIGGISKT